jgi:hypothetical protein
VKLFHSTLWGSSVEVTALPAYLFSEESGLAISAAELCVFSVCANAAKKAAANCRFTLTVTEIMKQTGYKKKAVLAALRSLCDRSFLKLHGKQQHRKPRTFEICNAENGEGLASHHTESRKWLSLRGALVADGLPYFWLPTMAIENLPQLSGSVFSLLVAVARLASMNNRDFEVEAAKLRFLCGLDFKTFKSAVTETQEDWVQIGFTDSTSRTVGVILLDPATGVSLEMSEAERQEREEAARAKRYKENREKNGKHSPLQLLAWALWALGDLQAHGGHGEFVTFCPNCRNTKKNRPGLHVNVFKGTHGVYRCFECGNGGKLLTLIREHFADFKIAVAKLYGIDAEHPELVQKAAQMLRHFDDDGKYRAA